MQTLETNGYDRKHSVVALYSRWIEQSQIRVRVKTVKETDKIIVDLFELSPEDTEVERTVLNAIAIEAARLHGASGHDFLVIRDYLTHRKASRIDGSYTYVNIREKSYVFSGVD